VNGISHFLATLLLSLAAASALVAEEPRYSLHLGDASKRILLSQMLDQLAQADVVIIGEEHLSPAAHQLEMRVLEGLWARRGNVILSLEMFERDTQETLNKYLSSQISEEEFLRTSRPWENYKTDYRPLVEFAKEKKIPVVAANVPREMARKMAREGMAALTDHPEWRAARTAAPRDKYFENFVQVMSGGHPGMETKAPTKEAREIPEAVVRAYDAQCLKDDTMAESIVRCFQNTPNSPIVVHFVGGFHSNYRLGTVSRIVDRNPSLKVSVVSCASTHNPLLDEAAPYTGLGDYIALITPGPERK
jgi:uncharacterized iron-regulated protein